MNQDEIFLMEIFYDKNNFRNSFNNAMSNRKHNFDSHADWKKFNVFIDRLEKKTAKQLEQFSDKFIEDLIRSENISKTELSRIIFCKNFYDCVLNNRNGDFLEFIQNNEINCDIQL
ncbi:hypothetical protein [Thomasclavelia cocleata]|jgi:hypothetical protein|uniref:hypothetical protein n=2 Tax=Thomasclavelia cocleata TaxID=69824 RepID=UPI0021705439|nr:hypothetical protein [Thomasclavelia cocleata]MCI9128384.1 hypothetical protein [Eubacterium sp.]